MSDMLFTYSTDLKNKVYRFALTLLGDEEDAKDVVQDVSEKMWTKRFVFKIYQNKEALSFKLTRDLCFDRLKHKNMKAEKYKVIRDETEISYETGHLVEERELGEITRKLVEKLPGKQKMVIHLRDMEELEFEEIAQILDMDIDAIRMNLSRARKTLREQLIKIMNYGIKQDQKDFGEIF